MNAFGQCVKTSSISIAERELRRPPLDGERVEQLRLVDDRGAAVDAQRLADPGDQEEQADVRVGEDVPQRVGEAVAGPLGHEQRPLVEHVDEPGRVAARADVAAAVGTRRREQHEGGEVDEPAGELVEPVDDLGADEVVRLAEQPRELGWSRSSHPRV